jgi:hypothetical protein
MVFLQTLTGAYEMTTQTEVHNTDNPQEAHFLLSVYGYVVTTAEVLDHLWENYDGNFTVTYPQGPETPYTYLIVVQD